MEILNIEEVGFYDTGKRTVSLTILNKNNKEKVINVETICGLYRKDLGCSICPVDEDLEKLFEGVFSGLNKDDFDDYDNDIEKIIEETERYMSRTYVLEVSNRNTDYVFKIFTSKVTLARINPEFTDAEISNNQSKYINIKDFDNLSEAKDFLRGIC